MAFRKLTSNAGFTVDITAVIGAGYAGLLRGVRGVPFGKNRDGTDDVRYVGDFYAPSKKWTTRTDIEVPDGWDGNWSAWLPTQLRNIFFDKTTNSLLIPRETPIILTYTGTVPTKGGGNDTHIFEVEGGDVGDPLDELTPDTTPPIDTRELVAVGRSSGNGRTRR